MFKWMMSLIIIFIISAEMNNSQLIALAKPTLAYSNAELDKLKSVADFKIFTLSFSIQNHKLEIKEPYPFNPDQEISKIRLHFFC